MCGMKLNQKATNDVMIISDEFFNGNGSFNVSQLLQLTNKFSAKINSGIIKPYQIDIQDHNLNKTTIVQKHEERHTNQESFVKPYANKADDAVHLLADQ